MLKESYGYLIGTHVRDKDAIIAAACMCEAALQMKLRGKTLVDLLYELYMIYGLFREKLLSFTFEGKEGREKINATMKQFRDHPPTWIGTQRVTRVEDYLSGKSFDGKKIEPLPLPQSNVIRFSLEDGSTITIRPSGTEPKMKIYGAVTAPKPPTILGLPQALFSCDHSRHPPLPHPIPPQYDSKLRVFS